MNAKRAARVATVAHPRRSTTKRTNTAANSNQSSHPQEDFTAVLSVFQAHLPARNKTVAQSLWNWKRQGPSLSGEVLAACLGKRRGIRQYSSVSELS
jgi:hypothetical protein